MTKLAPTLPVVLAGMLLDQLQAVLLGEQHEPVHRPLGLLRVGRLLLGRRHGGRHEGARGLGGGRRLAHGGEEGGDAVAEARAGPRRHLLRQVLPGRAGQKKTT